MIRYCPHHEISRLKWDACIELASPSLPYAFSWYLDIVSPGWDGMIAGDYEAVMPLTFKRKWFVTYIRKPYFVQQLGIFSQVTLSDSVIQSFIEQIPEKFHYIHTNLNELNRIGDNFTASNNINHLIHIDRDYPEIYKNYSRNCRRNIKKAMDAGLYLNSGMNIPAFVKFVFDNLGQHIPKLDRGQSIMLEKLIAAAQQRLAVQLTGVYTPQHELCAAGFFMQTRDRQVFSVCASSEKGKKYDAMYLLVNDQIHKSSGFTKWFDFSGSNIPGIAYFNQSFGAQAMSYPTLHLNRMPFFLRLVKP
ncbi:MAG: hypothetical protein JW973_10940 [Bacteroidales bacterium]|nr:hypothetical protein [Bacteroidales bacterium]